MKIFNIIFIILPFLIIGQNDVQEIQIDSGWSLFSTYIIPENNDIEIIFSSIIDDLIIIKDQNGNVYWPEFNLNSIGSIQIGEAYQIKMNNNRNLSITGLIINCNNSIELNEGWNLLGYLNNVISNVEDHFSNISELIILKDDSGNIYWPFYSINTI